MSTINDWWNNPPDDDEDEEVKATDFDNESEYMDYLRECEQAERIELGLESESEPEEQFGEGDPADYGDN